MCKFNLNVVLCGCEDWNCKMREAKFNSDNVPHTGHVKEIQGCYREGPMCINHFDNNDLHRLLVRWGMKPNNGNSTQDCKDAIYNIDRFQKVDDVCQDCLAICDQKCKTPEGHGKSKDTKTKAYKSQGQKDVAPASFPFLPGDAPLPPPGFGI